MLLGVSFGIACSYSVWGKELVIDWVKPWGNIFIKSLKLIAVPLILTSLIKGISDLKDLSSLSRLGTRTIALYIFTTLIAVSIGLIVVNLVEPGNSITKATRTSLLSSYSANAQERIEAAHKQKSESGPLQAIEDVVPDNFFMAASNNGKMLQVIFFAIFFGIGLILVPEEKSHPVTAFFDGANEVILKLIDLLMRTAPFGVFALLAALIVESPNADLFKALGMYAFCVVIGLAMMLLLYSIVIWTITKRTPSSFFSAMAPAQLLAFSTSSSAATLPVTMECVEERLGVSTRISSFVLPIGATINMDGTSLYQAVAAVFIAQALGIDLSLGAQLGILVTATLASIGSAAVPGAGMVMLVIVLAQAGIPEAGLALIFALDRPLDMMRTTINVTGDATVAVLQQHWDKDLK